MRKIKFSTEDYYHLYNRGVDKRPIFLDERDRERFLALMFLSNSNRNFVISRHDYDSWSFELALKEDTGDKIISIGAWVMMNNHFHILLREKIEGGISKFMHKISVGYTKYFNKKYHRTGSLFEGTFRAEHANTDPYLKYLYSYIHLNPIGLIDKGWKEKIISDKVKAKIFLKEYEYSSYNDYLDKDRLEGKIIDKESFPNYFNSMSDFEKMHNFWIENTKEPFKI